MPTQTTSVHLALLSPRVLVGLICALLTACGTQPIARTESHLRSSVVPPVAAQDKNIPAPVRQVPLPPPPAPKVDELRYSVSGVDLPAREILLAISRETKVNIDIHPGIQGSVTLNAIDQTLRQILTRMSRQLDMRWEMNGPNIVVMPDSPYLKSYRVDYVNIARDTTATFGIQTQVVTPAGVGQAGSSGGSGGGGGSGSNTSQLKVENTAKNRFWETLERNIKELLRDTDKQLPEGSSETVVRASTQATSTQQRVQATAAGARTTSARTTTTTQPGETQGINEQSVQTLTFREAASVIINAETGTISVRATSRQHEKVSEFIDQVSGVARRQVLIEATIVEVTLNDNYQSGVDWSALALENLGYSFRQNFTGGNLGTSPFFSVQYNNPNAAAGGSISSTIRLLSSFGDTKVLSSPRTVAMNNQTAVLKVVENRIYWTVKADTNVVGEGTAARTLVSYSSTPNVVPEGFVLSVTPQVGESDIVTLNVRPSISRISGYSNDPNPDLARAGVVSRVPEIQTREIETMMRVPSGITAVIGGLMQDSTSRSRDGIPFLSRLPWFGDAVSYRNDTGRKTELVVFLRPIVIKDNNVDTDMSEYRRYLPDGNFFNKSEASPLAKDPQGKGKSAAP